MRSEYAANLALQRPMSVQIGKQFYKPAPARIRKPFFHPKDRPVMVACFLILAALPFVI